MQFLSIKNFVSIEFVNLKFPSDKIVISISGLRELFKSVVSSELSHKLKEVSAEHSYSVDTSSIKANGASVYNVSSKPNIWSFKTICFELNVPFQYTCS